MLPLAYFGIESSGLSLVIDLLILFVVVLYFSLIYWTYTDARRRIIDPMLVGCATAASLFPFVGTIIYMILRPPEYLEDVRERELEMQAAEARLYDLDHGLCPHCDYRVERDFVRCPSCLRRLKERCVACQRPLDQEWAICPYCETEVPGAIPARRRRRRRDQGSGESLLIEGAARDPDSPAESDTDWEPEPGGELGSDPSLVVQRAATPAGRAAGGDDDPGAAPSAQQPKSSRSQGYGRAARPGSRSRPTS
jgi:hypothetical protein